ncbi:unnamed protein product [Sphagnum balticum]
MEKKDKQFDPFERINRAIKQNDSKLVKEIVVRSPVFRVMDSDMWTGPVADMIYGAHASVVLELADADELAVKFKNIKMIDRILYGAKDRDNVDAIITRLGVKVSDEMFKALLEEGKYDEIVSNYNYRENPSIQPADIDTIIQRCDADTIRLLDWALTINPTFTASMDIFEFWMSIPPAEHDKWKTARDVVRWFKTHHKQVLTVENVLDMKDVHLEFLMAFILDKKQDAPSDAPANSPEVAPA